MKPYKCRFTERINTQNASKANVSNLFLSAKVPRMYNKMPHIMCLFLVIFQTAFCDVDHTEDDHEDMTTQKIVRPVSYSFISANIHPKFQKIQTDEGEAFNYKTVLPGNNFDLQHEDYKDIVPAVQSYSELSDKEAPFLLTHSAISARPTQILTRTDITSHQKFKNNPRIDYSSSRKATIGSNNERPERIENYHTISEHLNDDERAEEQQPQQDNRKYANKIIINNHNEKLFPVTITESYPYETKHDDLGNTGTSLSEHLRPAFQNTIGRELPLKKVITAYSKGRTPKQSPEGEDQEKSASIGHSDNSHKSAVKDESSDYHESLKGEKGEKGYKKAKKHEKTAKGHHDKENHSGEYLDEKKASKKFNKGEEYYGEHHKAEKGAKDKKYGEGKNHKKGRTTHGEHNIVKKDEYIKSTKFYDEDHDDGEAEEHGEFHGEHEENHGGKKHGGHHQEGFRASEHLKKGAHDKGHIDEEHFGIEQEVGHDDLYAHAEEYGGRKGGHSAQKWKTHS